MQLSGSLDEGQKSWKDQEALITQLRERAEEYSKEILDQTKTIENYKSQRELIARRYAALERQFGPAEEAEKQERSRLQGLLDKERADCGPGNR